MLHTLMVMMLQLAVGGTLLYALLSTLLPFASGFISAEWAKGWAWVQNLGGVLGSVVGAGVAALAAFGFAWLLAHFPAIAQYIPADVHLLSTQSVIGILTGVLNAIFHVPTALKARRLERKMKF